MIKNLGMIVPYPIRHCLNSSYEVYILYHTIKGRMADIVMKEDVMELGDVPCVSSCEALVTMSGADQPTKEKVWCDWEMVSSHDDSTQWKIFKAKKLGKKITNFTRMNEKGFMDTWECIPLYRIYAKKRTV